MQINIVAFAALGKRTKYHIGSKHSRLTQGGKNETFNN